MSKKFNGMREGLTIVIVSTLIFFGILFWTDIKVMFTGEPKSKSKNKVKKEKKVNDTGDLDQNPGLKILERWELPSELTEISGIAFLPGGRFACVQDEIGTVYIFNIVDKKIEKEIPFSGNGDYEGITVVDQSIYIIRADGKLFMIQSMNDPKPVVKEFDTGLSIHNNIESLCYDKKAGRLLMTGKDEDPGQPAYKKVYSFNLQSKKLDKKPLFSIDLTDELVQGVKKGFQPSAIGIHPLNNNIYVVDGPSAKLLVVDAKGSIQNMYSLDRKELPQAEGITFDDTGKIFISTEGAKGSGAIVEVTTP